MSEHQTKVLSSDPEPGPWNSKIQFQVSRFLEGKEEIGGVIRATANLPKCEFSAVLRALAFELQHCARSITMGVIDPDFVLPKRLQLLDDIMGRLLRLDGKKQS